MQDRLVLWDDFDVIARFAQLEYARLVDILDGVAEAGAVVFFLEVPRAGLVGVAHACVVAFVAVSVAGAYFL